MPQQRVVARERRRQPPEKCYFCEVEKEPEYKTSLVLEKFLSRRGKIIARSRTGICARHQRRLSQEIKKARELALL